jgi:hypothetical protein
MALERLTLGHSNPTWEPRRALLRAHHRIAEVVDVRSRPVRRRCPRSNQRALTKALADEAIGDHFLGQALGGRCTEPGCRPTDPEPWAHRQAPPAFQAGLDHLSALAPMQRTAILGAERDPIHCPCAGWIRRRLRTDPIDLRPIHADGSTETQAALETRLRPLWGLDTSSGDRLPEGPEPHRGRAYDPQWRAVTG